MGEDTYAGALRAPHAGSPACFFFVLTYVKFKLENLRAKFMKDEATRKQYLQGTT